MVLSVCVSGNVTPGVPNHWLVGQLSGRNGHREEGHRGEAGALTPTPVGGRRQGCPLLSRRWRRVHNPSPTSTRWWEVRPGLCQDPGAPPT